MTPVGFAIILVLATDLGDYMSDDPYYVPPGQEWLGAFCINQKCGLPMLLVQITPDMLDAEGALTFRGGPQELKCRHCGTVSVYRPEQLQLLRTEEKTKLS